MAKHQSFPAQSFVPLQSTIHSVPPVPTSSESVATTSAWNTYRNTKYGFSFQYPSDFEVYLGIDVGNISEPFYQDDGAWVSVLPINGIDGDFGSMEITVHDENSTSTDEYNDPPGFWLTPLQTLMPKIHTLAEAERENDPLGPLTTSTIGGETAYEFRADHGTGWNGAGGLTDAPTLWIFMPVKDSVLEMIVSDTPTLVRVLQSVQLDK
jgi:hypothetical protein